VLQQKMPPRASRAAFFCLSVFGFGRTGAQLRLFIEQRHDLF